MSLESSDREPGSVRPVRKRPGLSKSGSSPLGLRVPSSSAKGPDVEEVHSEGPGETKGDRDGVESSPSGLRAPPSSGDAPAPEVQENPTMAPPTGTMVVRPGHLGPLLLADGAVSFMGQASPQIRRPTTRFHFLPEHLEVYYDFVTGRQTGAQQARRLGYGKSRTVYVDPGSSQHVFKIAPLQGHGPEPEAWRLLPYLVPSTMDAGEHLLTLFWRLQKHWEPIQ